MLHLKSIRYVRDMDGSIFQNYSVILPNYYLIERNWKEHPDWVLPKSLKQRLIKTSPEIFEEKYSWEESVQLKNENFTKAISKYN